MSEHMTNYNNIWNGKVEYIQNHTNLSSYQLSNRHEWSIYLYPSPIPHLILIIHFMIYSISNALLSQRIGKLHYFPYLAFLSILFVSIIQLYTLSIRFINYSQETIQSILLWQNKNHKYDQHNTHILMIFQVILDSKMINFCQNGKLVVVIIVCWMKSKYYSIQIQS